MTAKYNKISSKAQTYDTVFMRTNFTNAKQKHSNKLTKQIISIINSIFPFLLQIENERESKSM